MKRTVSAIVLLVTMAMTGACAAAGIHPGLPDTKTSIVTPTIAAPVAAKNTIQNVAQTEPDYQATNVALMTQLAQQNAQPAMVITATPSPTTRPTSTTVPSAIPQVNYQATNSVLMTQIAAKNSSAVVASPAPVQAQAPQAQLAAATVVPTSVPVAFTDLSKGLVVPQGQGCMVVYGDIVMIIQKGEFHQGFKCIDEAGQKWQDVNFNVDFAYSPQGAKGFDILSDGWVLPTEADSKRVTPDAFIPWSYEEKLTSTNNNFTLAENQWMWPTLFGVSPSQATSMIIGRAQFRDFSLNQAVAQSITRGDKTQPVKAGYDVERGTSDGVAMFFGGVGVVSFYYGDRLIADQVLLDLNPCWNCGGTTGGNALLDWAGNGHPQVGEKYSRLNFFWPLIKGDQTVITMTYAVRYASPNPKFPGTFIWWRGEHNPTAAEKDAQSGVLTSIMAATPAS